MEERDFAEGIGHAPPIPVGYAQEPAIELRASQAQFEGGIGFSGRHPNT